MKTGRIIILAVVLALALPTPIILAKEKVSLAYFFDPTWEVLFYAMREGKVKSELIDFTLHGLDIAALIQASGTKQYDLVEGSVVGVPQAKLRGLDQIIIGIGYKPKGGRFIMVKADSPIRKPEELKKRTLAVSSIPS